MLKLKKKLNFNFIIIAIFVCFLFPRGYLLDYSLKEINSISFNYSKHVDLRDYNYGISYGKLWNKKLQITLDYFKKNRYSSSNSYSSEWEEENSIILEDLVLEFDDIIPMGFV